MNTKVFLAIFVCLFSLQSFEVKANVEERRQKLIDIIDEELKEVIRLNRQIGSKNPNLLLRMGELYLEKARLINEKENMQWLALSPEDANRTNQKEFFKTSRNYFVMAQKTCYYILKRFKKFKGRGEVYYILAYNAKEFQQEKRAKQFFQKAIKYAKSGSYTAIKSKLALGEMYYNERQYKRAIPLYEQALKRKDQKWWTKDAYNLAWCYFREGRKNDAIQLMSEVHKLSGNASFVDVSDQVERDLAYFYSEAGRTQEALSFYKRIGKDLSSNFLKVGKYLKGQGKYAAAQSALVQASKSAETNEVRNEVNVELLSLYDKFGKTKEHLSVCRDLYEAFKKGELNEKQVEDLKYHVAKMSAQLQKSVVSKVNSKRKGVRLQVAGLATQYFQIQSGLSGELNHKSIFHAAETQYAVNDFDKAANLYNDAYDNSLKAGDSKIAALALDGLMASLSAKTVSGETKKRYLGKAYSIYLKSNPRSKESFKIYQRLFSEKMESGDVKGAEETLVAFKFHFPKSQKIQEAMLAKVMDYHKARKDRNEIKKWVDKINSGEFLVSQRFARQLRLILLSIQFDKVQKFNTEGEKVKALKGYITIYKEPTSSEDARKNAAYNIGILFHELGNKDKSYGWMKRALAMMDSKDVLRFEDSFLLVASGLFNFRDFKKSADLYELTLEKICKQKRSKNKDTFFKNASIIYLADNDARKAAEVLKLGETCNVNRTLTRNASLDLLKQLGKEERWPSFENLLSQLKRNSSNLPYLIAPMAKLRNAYKSRGRIDESTSVNLELMKLYQQSRTLGKKIPLEALDVIAQNRLEELQRVADQLEGIKLSFPEQKYNDLLKSKFKYLDSVTSKALELFKVGSGEGIVNGYRILVESYKNLGRDIISFTPPGKGEGYVTSFKKSMAGIAGPILSKAKEFESEAIRQIRGSKILSESNFYFMRNSTLPIVPRYFAVKKGVLMDRGGKQ